LDNIHRIPLNQFLDLKPGKLYKNNRKRPLPVIDALSAKKGQIKISHLHQNDIVLFLYEDLWRGDDNPCWIFLSPNGKLIEIDDCVFSPIEVKQNV